MTGQTISTEFFVSSYSVDAEGAKTVLLLPCWSGSHANKAVFGDRPPCSISMGPIKPDVAMNFEIPSHFRVDFTRIRP